MSRVARGRKDIVLGKRAPGKGPRFYGKTKFTPDLGVGEAQVWNENSVSKVPALWVARYSWLLLAGLEGYGPKRTSDYEPLPKWRRGAKRPSCLDRGTLLRKQRAENPVKFATGTAAPTYAGMVGAAAA